MTKKAIAALSGGVDSSVCAALLLKQGYEVIGMHLKLWENQNEEQAERDAKAVAGKLGIEFVCVDMRKDFYENVVNYFNDAYIKGDTPNPCVMCNKTIKFGKVFDFADSIGAEYVATGHYAQIEFNDGQYLLKKAADPKKDQSYVLYNLTQDKLKRILLPLGGYTKDEAKEFSSELDLEVHKKAESQDICFIPDGDYASFVKQRCDKTVPTGDFVDSSGNILGRHKGLLHYTLGQRRGLGISSTDRLYVIEKNIKNNLVVLGSESGLYKSDFIVTDVNMISGKEVQEPFFASVKTRYSAKQAACTVIPCDGYFKIQLNEPQRAITNGQSAVFYDNDTVLGGGIIR